MGVGMSEKLGPCPLCGGDWRFSDNDKQVVSCFNGVECDAYGLEMPLTAWSRLSAMAASERRMREALERCQRTLGFLHVCAANAGLLLPADEEKYQDVCAGIDEALSEGGKQR